jgi:uncharacterized protein with von Willebrand factor type A (vWA) domain
VVFPRLIKHLRENDVERSALIMNLTDSCFQYDDKKNEIKEEFILKIQNVLKDLLLDYKFTLSLSNLDSFNSLMLTNAKFYKARAYDVRQRAVENTHKILMLFNSLKKTEEFNEGRMNQSFLPVITDALLLLATEADESIRILVIEVF